jgi:hypothetical protein
MLLVLAIILVIFWLIGVVVHIAGGLIHLVLLVALVMFVLHLLKGRKSAP